MAEAGRAPAVEDFINQVIRNRIVLCNQGMTIFAFPRATIVVLYLFEYYGHFYLRMDSLVPFSLL